MKTSRTINAANAYMLSHITGKDRKTESTPSTCTFNLLLWMRARRKKWLGHILRMEDTRLVKQAVKHIYSFRSEGDLLMDEDNRHSWKRLQELATDRATWRAVVRQMRRQVMGKNWDESRQRVRQKRKELKNPKMKNRRQVYSNTQQGQHNQKKQTKQDGDSSN